MLVCMYMYASRCMCMCHVIRMCIHTCVCKHAHLKNIHRGMPHTYIHSCTYVSTVHGPWAAHCSTRFVYIHMCRQINTGLVPTSKTSVCCDCVLLVMQILERTYFSQRNFSYLLELCRVEEIKGPRQTELPSAQGFCPLCKASAFSECFEPLHNDFLHNPFWAFSHFLIFCLPMCFLPLFIRVTRKGAPRGVGFPISNWCP